MMHFQIIHLYTKAKNKGRFLVALVPCGNPVYVPHWKVVTIGALFEWQLDAPKKVNTFCPFLKVPF